MNTSELKKSTSYFLTNFSSRLLYQTEIKKIINLNQSISIIEKIRSQINLLNKCKIYEINESNLRSIWILYYVKRNPILFSFKRCHIIVKIVEMFERKRLYLSWKCKLFLWANRKGVIMKILFINYLLLDIK